MYISAYFTTPTFLDIEIKMTLKKSNIAGIVQ